MLGVSQRQRIEVRSGEVSKGKTVFDSFVHECCIKIAQALPAIGPITVQCIVAEGTPYFTEINARMGGGLPLGIAAGVDAPTWIVAQLAGISLALPAAGEYKVGLYMTRFDDTVLSLRMNMRNVQAIIFDLDDTLYPEKTFVFSGFLAVASWASGNLGIPMQRGFDELKTIFEAGKPR